MSIVLAIRNIMNSGFLGFGEDISAYSGWRGVPNYAQANNYLTHIGNAA
jgi:hypothetical protein